MSQSPCPPVWSRLIRRSSQPVRQRRSFLKDGNSDYLVYLVSYYHHLPIRISFILSSTGSRSSRVSCLLPTRVLNAENQPTAFLVVVVSGSVLNMSNINITSFAHSHLSSSSSSMSSLTPSSRPGSSPL